MTLWMLGDIYSRAKQASKNEDDKNHWADLAGECYSRLLRNYPLSPLADDAKSRLKAMGMSVPAADPNAVAEMKKQQLYEKQHAGHSFVKLPMSLVKSMPNVTAAARSGQPNLNPPDDAVSATDVLKPGASGPSFNLAMRPAETSGTNAENGAEVGAPVEAVPVAAAESSSATGNNVGVQIIDTGGGSSQAQSTTSAPAAAVDNTSSAPTITLQPVAPSAAPGAAASPAPATTASPAPPENSATAATEGNAATAPATTTEGGGTIAAPPVQQADKADPKTESTSKKKKGIHKIIPL